MGPPLRYPRLCHLAAQLPRDLHGRESERRVLRVRRQADSPAGEGSGRRREADTRDHGFGVQRVPMETRYFEAYNRDNAHLVDITETPIVEVTETGLRTTERDYDFDIIVYATGFDAITGAFDNIDIRGVDGLKLRDKWSDGPSTFLGVFVNGFPNFLMPSGPQSGSASTNYPPGHRNRGRLVHEISRVYVGSRLRSRRTDNRGRATLDRPREKDVLDDADAESQVLVHRIQLEHLRAMSMARLGTSFTTGAPRNTSARSRRSRTAATRASFSAQVRCGPLALKPRRSEKKSRSESGWIRRMRRSSRDRLRIRCCELLPGAKARRQRAATGSPIGLCNRPE